VEEPGRSDLSSHLQQNRVEEGFNREESGEAGVSAADRERCERVMDGGEREEEGRRLLTAEVNAAVRGAEAAGATEIVVPDRLGRDVILPQGQLL
jgi:hypothetical protein